VTTACSTDGQTIPAWFSHSAPAVAAPSALPPNADVCLFPGSEPFSHKLVEKDRSDAFVEQKEFLGDNISLLNELECVCGVKPQQLLSGAHKPRLQDYFSLTSWVYCFLAYAALCCADKETRECLS